MNAKELSFSNEIFTDLRIKMDTALNAVISNLISKKLHSGKLTAKVEIELEEKADPDTGEIYYMPIFEPVVNISIGGKAKLECGTQEGLILKKSRCGKNIIAKNQISMEDLEEADRKGA